MYTSISNYLTLVIRQNNAKLHSNFSIVCTSYYNMYHVYMIQQEEKISMTSCLGKSPACHLFCLHHVVNLPARYESKW